MGKTRLEALSDRVIAVIIIIMALGLTVPHGKDLTALGENWPIFLSYMLSFVNIGIFWKNHRKLLHTVKYVTGPIIWANLNLLFWLSLFPFTTGWMGESHFATWPVCTYGVVLMLAGASYFLLARTIVVAH